MNNQKIKHAVHNLTRSTEAHVYTTESNQSVQTLAVLIVPKLNTKASVTTSSMQKINKSVLKNLQSNTTLIEDDKIVYDFSKHIDHHFDQTAFAVQDPRRKTSRITHEEITAAWVALSAQQKKEHVQAQYTAAALSLGISSKTPNEIHRIVRQLKRWIANPKTHDFVISLAPENLDVNLIVTKVLITKVGGVDTSHGRSVDFTWTINKVLHGHYA